MGAQLCYEVLPDDEQPHARIIAGLLGDLPGLVERFHAALDIERIAATVERVGWNARLQGGFQELNTVLDRDTLMRFGTWGSIAARDAVLTVNDFRVVLININAALERCPMLKSYMEQGRRNTGAAIARLDRTFPGVVRARDALAHPTDMAGSVRKREANAFSGTLDPGGPVAAEWPVSDLLISAATASAVTVTIDKRIITIPFDAEALTALREAKALAEAVFEPAKIKTTEMLAEKLRPR